MLNDLFGYVKRNHKNLNDHQTRKLLTEIKLIVKLLENKLEKVS
jgi:hypothetical protein